MVPIVCVTKYDYELNVTKQHKKIIQIINTIVDAIVTMFNSKPWHSTTLCLYEWLKKCNSSELNALVCKKNNSVWSASILAVILGFYGFSTRKPSYWTVTGQRSKCRMSRLDIYPPRSSFHVQRFDLVFVLFKIF